MNTHLRTHFVHFFVITLCILLGIPNLLQAQQLKPVDNFSSGELQRFYDQDNATSGTILVKFTSDFADQVATHLKRRSKTAGGPIQLGVSEMDQLNQEYSVESMERAFHYAGKYEAMHRKYGLHQWYILHVDKGSEGDAIYDYSSVTDVSYVQPTMKMKRADKNEKLLAAASFTPDDPKFSEQWHYNNTGQIDGASDADIDLPEALDIEGGREEVIVSIVDGGIDTDHPDLQNMLWVNTAEQNGTDGVDDDNNGYVDDIHGWNHANKNNNTDDDASDSGHGTHVAGTVAAQTNNATGVAGIAGGNGTDSGVRLMANRVFGRYGEQATNFGDALIYAADNGAVISQNSWGYGGRLSSIFQAEKEAIDYFNERAGLDNSDANGDGTPDQDTQIGPMKGGLVVFAAGNSNADSKNGKHWYPAYYDTVMAVAASTNKDTRAVYSNYGTWIDITAPGGQIENFSLTNSPRGILSTIPQDSNTQSALYGWYQGTSMACPHVSGVAALVVSKLGNFSDQSGQNITSNELRSILEGSADYIEDQNPYYRNELGKGRLNAAKALQGRNTTPPAALSDLSASAVKSDAIALEWTAPGADGADGRAYKYELRYSTSSITASNFSNATLVETPSPDSASNTQQKEIKNLAYNTTYYIGMVAYDGYGNQSDLVTKQYTTGPAPTVSVSQTEIEAFVPSDSTVTKDLVITNNGNSGSVLEFGFEGYSQPDHLKSGEASDGSGYTYIDSNEEGGPTYDWKDISRIGTRVQNAYTEMPVEITLPFNFPFYGEEMKTIRISGGGALAFGTPSPEAAWYGESPIPSHGSTMPFDWFIAPFSGVAHTDANKPVNILHYYNPETGNLIIQWNNVLKPSYESAASDGDTTSTFQAILNRRGGIKFQYQKIGVPTSVGLVGIENKDGTKGLQIDSGTDYIKEGLAIRITSPKDWLRIEPSNGEIASGQQKTVTMTFDGAAPLFTGSYRKALTLATNDGQGSNKEISILSTLHLQQSSSSNPVIGLSPTELSTEAAQGETGSWPVTISNSGSQALDWSATPDNNWLSVSTASGSIPAGETQTITVQYYTDGLSAQTHNGSITISSNDPNNGTSTVDVALTVNNKVVNMSEMITVSDGINSQSLTFGLSDNGTAGFDDGLDLEAPPEPPSGSFFAHFVSQDINFWEDYRLNTAEEVLWPVVFAPQEGQSTITVSWNIEGNGTTYHLIDDKANPTFQVDMLQNTSHSVSTTGKDTLWVARNYSGATGGGETVTVSPEYRQGWNMVALPVTMGSASVSNLFSNATEGTAYGYDGAYTSQSNIQFKDGYWLQLNNASTPSFTGGKVDSMTYEMRNGWNMVGSLSDTLKDLSTIIDTGNVIVQGTIYTFDGAYQTASQIVPGQGYFIKASESASIVLDLNPNQAKTQTPKIAAPSDATTDFDSFTLSSADETQQVLYANHSLPDGWSRENFELPPPPKGAALDVRMENDFRLTTANSFVFTMDAQQYPVTIALSNGANSSAQYEVKAYTNGNVSQTWNIAGGQEITVNEPYDRYEVNESNTTAIREPGEIPDEYGLDQNYPNPFNPTTKIKYQIPEAGAVQLTVYNLLGRRVATLVSERQAAGSYSVQFDASKLSSGVYIYRLTAENTSITQKMVLMK